MSVASRSTRPTRHGWTRSLGALLAGMALASCQNELAPTSIRTVGIAKGAGWRDTLSIAEIRTVDVSVVDLASGRSIEGAAIEWTSSDSEMLGVVGRGRTAILTTQSNGRAVITATIRGRGLADTSLVVPIVVANRGWKRALTVGKVDTGRVRIYDPSRLLTGLRPTFSSQSSNPSVVIPIVRAFPNADSSLVELYLPTLKTGSALVTLTTTLRDGSKFDLTIDVFAGAPRIVLDSISPASVNVGNRATLGVTLYETLGDTIWPGPHPIFWSSSNPSAFSVDDNGQVTGLARGGGDIVVSVGSADEPTAQLKVPFRVLEHWFAIDAGYAHACAISRTTRTGFCWGSNEFGELGNGLRGGREALPSRVATDVRLEELSAGGATLPVDVTASPREAHTCGRATDNVYCWGSNFSGQIGDPTRALCPYVPGLSGCAPPLPTLIFSASTLYGAPRHVDAGGLLSCLTTTILTTSRDEVTCWGRQTLGARGANDSTFGRLPFDRSVDFTAANTSIAAGGAHVCFTFGTASRARRVSCYGSNEWGQLGDGSTVDAPLPAQQTPQPDSRHVTKGDTGDPLVAQTLSAGGKHTCALEAASPGRVWCWGANGFGQLGTLATDRCKLGELCSRRAVAVSVQGFSSVAAGFEHTCALTPTGQAWCWGSNSDGQLGRGTVGGSNAVPQPIRGSLTFASLTAGQASTCGLTTDGSMYCWGRNSDGQLGNGTFVGSSVPVRVSEPPT